MAILKSLSQRVTSRGDKESGSPKSSESRPSNLVEPSPFVREDTWREDDGTDQEVYPLYLAMRKPPLSKHHSPPMPPDTSNADRVQKSLKKISKLCGTPVINTITRRGTVRQKTQGTMDEFLVYPISPDMDRSPDLSNDDNHDDHHNTIKSPTSVESPKTASPISSSAHKRPTSSTLLHHSFVDFPDQLVHPALRSAANSPVENRDVAQKSHEKYHAQHRASLEPSRVSCQSTRAATKHFWTEHMDYLICIHEVLDVHVDITVSVLRSQFSHEIGKREMTEDTVRARLGFLEGLENWKGFEVGLRFLKASRAARDRQEHGLGISGLEDGGSRPMSTTDDTPTSEGPGAVPARIESPHERQDSREFCPTELNAMHNAYPHDSAYELDACETARPGASPPNTVHYDASVTTTTGSPTELAMPFPPPPAPCPPTAPYHSNPPLAPAKPNVPPRRASNQAKTVGPATQMARQVATSQTDNDAPSSIPTGTEQPPPRIHQPNPSCSKFYAPELTPVPEMVEDQGTPSPAEAQRSRFPSLELAHSPPPASVRSGESGGKTVQAFAGPDLDLDREMNRTDEVLDGLIDEVEGQRSGAGKWERYGKGETVGYFLPCDVDMPWL